MHETNVDKYSKKFISLGIEFTIEKGGHREALSITWLLRRSKSANQTFDINLSQIEEIYFENNPLKYQSPLFHHIYHCYLRTITHRGIT